MDALTSFRLRTADWERERQALRLVRDEVFVREQHVPPEVEWDEMDTLCLHVLALDADGVPVGTGRLAPDGKIGRMAVLKEWRGRGVGTALLKSLVDSARQRGLKCCYLNAQSHALEFYRRHGFEARGDEFLEAGIPHRAMRRDL